MNDLYSRNENGDVVCETDVQVTSVAAQVTLFVRISSFEYQCDDGENRFDLNIFWQRSELHDGVIGRRYARRMPRFNMRNVKGSLTSISLLKSETGKSWCFGGRPCKRMIRDLSPPSPVSANEEQAHNAPT